MGNQILILPLVLELALAIAVVAILVIEHHYPARSNLHDFHLIYNILRFHAIGSDVLHGTRSHFARNDAQVLGTMIAMLHGVSHHIVEHLATAATQEHKLRIQQGIIMLCCGQFAITKHLNSHDGRMEHRALVIACKQEITAATQDEQRLISISKPSHNLLRLFYR